jgi:LuxR family maltose regulon positive regulatory protein
VAKAATIVSRAAMEYVFRSGQVETVRRWLELFNDDQIQSDAPLTLVAGLLYSMSGDPRLGHLWIDTALGARADDSLAADGGTTLGGWQALLRAITSHQGLTRMREDAELAASPEVAVSPMWRSGGGTLLGCARWLSGDVPAAQEVLRRTVKEGRTSNVNAEIAALGFLSVVAADGGHWEEAESWAREARQRFVESGFGQIPPMVIVFLAEARVLAHRADSGARDPAAVAVGMFEERQLLWPWLESLTATTLAEIFFDLGDIEETQRWTSAASLCLATWPDAGILRDRVAHLASALLQRRGVEPLSRAEVRVLELLPSQLSNDEIASRLFLSVNTVKSHIRAIYRKLGTASRTQAVERAREVGLLTK